MKNQKITLIAVLLINGLITNPAMAARIIDAMQPAISSSSTLAIGGSSEQKLAQTITLSETGILKGVFLPLGCSTGKLVITLTNVESNQPGSVILDQKRIRAHRINNPVTTFRYFGLPGAVTVYAGDEIAIILDNPSGTCGLSRSPDGDSYTAGAGFFDSRPNPPGWIALSETDSDWDLPFMLVIKTP